MGKKKNTRLFSREERRENRQRAQLRLAAMTPEQIQQEKDVAILGGYDNSNAFLEDPRSIAEAWRSIEEDTGREPEEVELAHALARQFKRLTGDTLTVEIADAYEDAEEHQRELEAIERGEI